MTEQYCAFVGIDWASEKHQVCLLDAAGTVLGERLFAHSGRGLAELCDWLIERGAIVSFTRRPPSSLNTTLQVGE